MHAVIELAVMHDGILGIAGHEQDLETGNEVGQLPDEFLAAHLARQHDVGQYHVERSGLLGAEEAGSLDMVLTDVVLPGEMRGKELVRQLTDLIPGLKVLFMSGYTENAIVHHGKLDDGVHLLSKPFKRDQLARKVAEVLGASPIEADNVIRLSTVQKPKG